MAVRPSIPRYRKPLLGSLLDRAHPLAPDLGCWWLNEGCGQRINDAALGASATGGGQGTWVSDPLYGAALQTAAGGSNYFPLAATPPAATRFTIATRAVMSVSFGSYYGLYGDGGGQFALVANPSRILSYFTGVDNLSSFTVTIGQWFDAAVTYDGVTLRFYVNGQPAGTSAGAGLHLPRGTGVVILSNGTTPSQTWPGSMTYLYIWSRPLSFPDVQRLQADPFAVALPPEPRRSWFLPPSFGTPAQISVVREANYQIPSGVVIGNRLPANLPPVISTVLVGREADFRAAEPEPGRVRALSGVGNPQSPLSSVVAKQELYLPIEGVLSFAGVATVEGNADNPVGLGGVFSQLGYLPFSGIGIALPILGVNSIIPVEGLVVSGGNILPGLGGVWISLGASGNSLTPVQAVLAKQDLYLPIEGALSFVGTAEVEGNPISPVPGVVVSQPAYQPDNTGCWLISPVLAGNSICPVQVYTAWQVAAPPTDGAVIFNAYSMEAVGNVVFPARIFTAYQDFSKLAGDDGAALYSYGKLGGGGGDADAPFFDPFKHRRRRRLAEAAKDKKRREEEELIALLIHAGILED